MKKYTLHICLILSLSACNEGSREITDSPEKSSITETRYESTVNQTLDEANNPDTQAPNFRFRDSFTEKNISAETPAPAIETKSTTETVHHNTSTPVAEEKTVITHPATETLPTEVQTGNTPSQKTAKVFNLPENDTLNVRKKAGTNNAVLEKLAPNSEVIVTGESKTTKDGQQWFEIITKKSITGWVNDHYLKLNK